MVLDNVALVIKQLTSKNQLKLLTSILNNRNHQQTHRTMKKDPKQPIKNQNRLHQSIQSKTNQNYTQNLQPITIF